MKSTHGGKRAGSGRKPIGRGKLVSVRPHIWEQVAIWAEANGGLTVTAAVNQLIVRGMKG